jgi:hypothetical protein
MGEPEVTRRSAAREVDAQAFARLSANDLADLLLLALVERGAGTMIVLPSAGGHAVHYESGGSTSEIVTIPAALGDALVARFAILAELPVGATEAQIGRIRVRPSTPMDEAAVPVTEILLAVRTVGEGMIAELHRIGSLSDRAIPRTPNAGADLGARDVQVGMYRIRDELGRGGMGVVYNAVHVALDKPVALKVLHPEVASMPTVAAQFMVEARAACRARHPGIVDVTDFGYLPDGRAYLVMELVDAPTLSDLLRHGALDPRRSIAIAQAVADALGAASAQGVVHRDLTPANIFVGAGDRIKIGDFGLARIVDPTTGGVEPESETVVGTAGYMSPEQGLCDVVDTRSDIYSLGVVLFRMLTGHLPFDGKTLVEIIMLHMTKPVPLMIGPEGPLPDVLQRLVERAMAKRREERFQSCGELHAALAEADRTLAREGWRSLLPR